MIDDTLLSVLACPETKKNLVLAEDDLIARVNDKIKQGQVLTRMKVKVKDCIDGGLLREGDMSCLYPVRNNVPVLLVEELIDIQNI